MLGVSEATLDAVDAEVHRLVDECYRQATAILTSNRRRLDALVAQLLEHETLDEVAAYQAAGVGRETGTATAERAAPSVGS